MFTFIALRSGGDKDKGLISMSEIAWDKDNSL